jgi:spermidine/putrescine transport system substrate-binding protein
MSDPWDVLWDPKWKGQAGIYDDYRESISLALLKSGVTDLNTTAQSDLAEAQKNLLDLINMVDVRTDINGVYIGMPAGRFDVHLAWSGDAVAAWGYWPKQNMESYEKMGYWFPPDRVGPINNDLITIPAGAPHPVLAHKFLDWMMAFDNAMLNFAWNGYQPPQRRADPDTLTTTKGYYGVPYVFPWLSDAVVRESDFQSGRLELELTPQVDQAWHNVWQSFNAGVS